MSFKGKRIWIIGASSGIGKALAYELASRGAILTLSARDGHKLEEICRKLGPGHESYPLDVTKGGDFKTAALRISSFECALYFAGSYQPMNLLSMDAEIVRQIIDTNLQGALNFIDAIAPSIKEGKVKQIALCGSVAGYCGLSNGQPYSATKAAIINLAESLRLEVPESVDVKLISPGFVHTPMTDKNHFKMPMVIEPEQAAKAIADGLLSSSFEIHFPKRFTWIMKLISLLPYELYFQIARKLK